MEVTEQRTQIAMPGGLADASVFQPKHGSSQLRPGVIDLPDIRSIREATFANSRRLAEAGYVVLTPNPFYRTARPPVVDFPMNFAEERTRRRFAELTDPLTPEAMHADAAGYHEALGRFGANTSSVGVVGHCFTGAQALRTAAALPQAVRATVSLHGGHLVTAAGDASSPHRELPQIRAALFFAHATGDASMPADKIQLLEEALRAWGGSWESETFPARHGWTVSDSASFDPGQAERALEEVMALFRTYLH